MATTTRVRSLNLGTADVTSADGTVHFDPVRFGARAGTADVPAHAWAMDRTGRRVWEAHITGWDKIEKNHYLIHLADGPDVTVRSYCRPCAGRH